MSVRELKLGQNERYERLKRRIEHLEKSYKVNPLIDPYVPTLSKLPCPPPAWFKFFRLKEAIEQAHRDSSGDVRVFACEPKEDLASSGRREFIIASYEEFWFYYSQMKPDNRHFYEVIQEGAACHLYFDLEFSKCYNPSLNGDDLLERFLTYVFEKVERSFGVEISKRHVLDLDSTSETKFSRHLIIHIPNTIFRSNRDVGAFVTKICAESDSDFVVNTSDKPTYFIDTGVYSKNRNFRLFLSSKKGKSSILKRHQNCKFDLNFQDTRSACCIHHFRKHGENMKNSSKIITKSNDELVFYASLITNVKYHENLRILTCAAEIDPVHKESKTFSSDQSWQKNSPSPFPLLQNFISSLLSRYGQQGYVSKYVYFPSNRTVIFNILGTRFCGNIDRQHKSNHIYYVADLIEKCCYQKCYDPVCVADRYRSSPFPIPNHILETLFDDIDDMDLVNEVEQVENREKMQEIDLWGDVSDDVLLSVANDSLTD